MRQNESIVVVVTCRRRLGAGVAAAGRGCARARGAAASEFVRLVCPHEESANVDKEGCSSLAAARRAHGVRARARGFASAILVVGCRHDARVSAGRSRVANIGCISGRGARRRGRRCAEQRRRCAPEGHRASPTKPERFSDGACGAAAARVWSAWRRRGAGGARARVARRRHVGKAQDQRPQWKRPRPDICTPGDLHPH